MICNSPNWTMGIVKFRSKAAAEIVMMKSHAQLLLQIIGRELTDKGVIETNDLSEAAAKIQAAMIQEKMAEAEKPPLTEDEEAAIPKGMAAPVNLNQRAYPLLRMMQLAQESGVDVHWGF